MLARVDRNSSGQVSRAEISNILENIKTNILIMLSSKLSTLQAKKKNVEV